MTPLPSNVRALLARARAEQASADPEIKQRVLRGITGSLAAGAPGAHVEHAPSPKYAGRAGSVVAGKKLAVLALMVSLGGLSAWGLGRGAGDTPRSAPAMVPAGVRQAPVTIASSTEAPQRSAELVKAPRALREGPAEPTPSSAPRELRDQVLTGELRLIGRAEAALRRGELGAAATALALHERRYPSGQLATERDGLSLVVRCAGGREMTQEARRYLASSPDGIVAERVAEECGVAR